MNNVPSLGGVVPNSLLQWMDFYKQNNMGPENNAPYSAGVSSVGVTPRPTFNTNAMSADWATKMMKQFGQMPAQPTQPTAPPSSPGTNFLRQYLAGG